ncbi:MAG: hypothetical protein KDA92_17235, partial [Planctomycetales bacterium]|nr:hypothetical protein [Planctomycetales bacterium]
DLLLAYVSPGHAKQFTVNLSKLKPHLQATWWDPSSGASTTIGDIQNQQTATFTPPAKNTAGDTDWLLRLEAVR